jgi:GNAT superfamily N-acetyltransferase
MYKITTATENDISLIIDYAAREGWNPGLEDDKAFYAIDPQGCSLGKLNNQIIACISNMQYDKYYSFMGFYIVNPAFRRQNYGYQLFDYAIKQTPHHLIGLDGVVEQQNNYAKWGFQLAHRNVRYKINHCQKKIIDNTAIKLLSSHDIDKLLVYDQDFFPASRSKFLHKWINMSNAKHFIYKTNQQIQGYGCIRKCREGYKIGPLFSNSTEIAQSLLDSLLSQAQAEPVYIDIPEINKNALNLINNYPIEKVFETARMYRGKEPDISIDRTYGITSYEVG